MDKLSIQDSMWGTDELTEDIINHRSTRKSSIAMHDSYFSEMKLKPKKLIHVVTFTMTTEGTYMIRTVETVVNVLSKIGGFVTTVAYCFSIIYAILIMPITDYKLFYAFSKKLHTSKQDLNDEHWETMSSNSFRMFYLVYS